MEQKGVPQVVPLSSPGTEEQGYRVDGRKSLNRWCQGSPYLPGQHPVQRPVQQEVEARMKKQESAIDDDQVAMRIYFNMVL